MNFSASPISDVGGIGFLLLTAHLPVTVAGAWVALATAMIAGAGFGLVLVARRARRLPPSGLQSYLRTR